MRCTYVANNDLIQISYKVIQLHIECDSELKLRAPGAYFVTITFTPLLS
jgi:hypothetical protein